MESTDVWFTFSKFSKSIKSKQRWIQTGQIFQKVAFLYTVYFVLINSWPFQGDGPITKLKVPYRGLKMREILVFYPEKNVVILFFFNLFILKLKHEERLWPRGRFHVHRQCWLCGTIPAPSLAPRLPRVCCPESSCLVFSLRYVWM